MSVEYISKVDVRRSRLGVSSLDASGMAVDHSSRTYVRNLVESESFKILAQLVKYQYYLIKENPVLEVITNNL